MIEQLSYGMGHSRKPVVLCILQKAFRLDCLHPHTHLLHNSRLPHFVHNIRKALVLSTCQQGLISQNICVNQPGCLENIMRKIYHRQGQKENSETGRAQTSWKRRRDGNNMSGLQSECCKSWGTQLHFPPVFLIMYSCFTACFGRLLLSNQMAVIINLLSRIGSDTAYSSGSITHDRKEDWEEGTEQLSIQESVKNHEDV